jgi:hypothetical protein
MKYQSENGQTRTSKYIRGGMRGSSSTFNYSPAGHAITGDDIFENENLN